MRSNRVRSKSLRASNGGGRCEEILLSSEGILFISEDFRPKSCGLPVWCIALKRRKYRYISSLTDDSILLIPKISEKNMDDKAKVLIQKIAAKKKISDLRRLHYSPDKNPLLDPDGIPVKKRWVRTSGAKELVDTTTGEVSGLAAIHTIEERDDAEFVKVFADGVKAAFGLTKTAHRVFKIVRGIYENTPMRGGYAASLYIAWFDGGLAGRDIGMSDRTFHIGLKELLEKEFLAAKAPNLFWVNPTLFFKGDRVAFVKEYRRKPKQAVVDDNPVE